MTNNQAAGIFCGDGAYARAMADQGKHLFLMLFRVRVVLSGRGQMAANYNY